MATAQKAIWFQTSQEQLDAVLFEVCEELQLTPARYQMAVERYGTVNEILEKAGSPFHFLTAADLSARFHGARHHLQTSLRAPRS
jgi:hypothetical protein